MEADSGFETVAMKDGMGESINSPPARPPMRGARLSVAMPCRMAYDGVMAGRPRMKHRRVSDAFDELRSAGGILLTAAPDEYISGEFKGDTPLSNAWSDSVDAMFTACGEVEELLKLLAEKAGLPPPESHFSGSDDQPVTCDPDATAA